MSGYIFAIGGGNNICSDIFEKIFEKSKNKNILIISDASTNLLTSQITKTKQRFNQFGKNGVNIKNIKLKNITSNKIIKDDLHKYGIIYFTGGHQIDLLKSINNFNKNFKCNIRDILIKYLKNGGVISGTSAGASILGKLMPTGKILKKRDNQYVLKPLNMKLVNKIYIVEKSLNLVPYIIDQHFTEKKRHERGKAMAIDNKMKLIGIDENTAIYFKYGSPKITLIGKGKATLYNGSLIKYSYGSKYISITGFKTKIY